jgi:tight adherence protein C
MNPQTSIPILIALIAFFIADENNRFIQIVYRATLNLANRKSVEMRLAQVGKNQITDYENFRISQLTYVATSIAIATFSLTLGIIGFWIFLLLILLLPPTTVALTERHLSRRVVARKVAIESEFPAIVEMLTLAVGSGESPPSALKRITQRAHGHLALEFTQVVREVESGASFTSSLDEMSKRLNSSSLRRFVDSLIISILRGTPLVETLTHSVSESRNQERVRLLTAAGKSEISMMIPVVFLILPISILFALYPSLTNLNLFSN